MEARYLNVVDVLNRLGITPVKTNSREIWACCPLHRVKGQIERTPSFRVRNDPHHEKHGFWQCFGGCPPHARGGGLVGLVRLVLKLETWKEARAWIAGNVPEQPPEPPPARVVVESSAPVPGCRGLKIPPGVVVVPVDRWPGPAREYLTETRGVPASQAERWGLGYAAGGRLAGRIFVPVRDDRGVLLNYTSRLFYGRGPKTKEPDRNEGADKGAVFGETHWPDRGERRIVVLNEGSFDALAVERIADLPVGAIFGSELLEGHILRLGTFDGIVVCSDPDEAGDKLWDEARDAFGRTRKVSRVLLPRGSDAADLALSNPDLLAERLHEAVERVCIAIS